MVQKEEAPSDSLGGNGPRAGAGALGGVIEEEAVNQIIGAPSILSRWHGSGQI